MRFTYTMYLHSLIISSFRGTSQFDLMPMESWSRLIVRQRRGCAGVSRLPWSTPLTRVSSELTLSPEVLSSTKAFSC